MVGKAKRPRLHRAAPRPWPARDPPPPPPLPEPGPAAGGWSAPAGKDWDLSSPGVFSGLKIDPDTLVKKLDFDSRSIISSRTGDYLSISVLQMLSCFEIRYMCSKKRRGEEWAMKVLSIVAQLHVGKAEREAFEKEVRSYLIDCVGAQWKSSRKVPPSLLSTELSRDESWLFCRGRFRALAVAGQSLGMFTRPDGGLEEKTVLSKKEKMKLRKERWLQKIESVKLAKQKQKAEAKRKATPVVGDMQPLMEALPELSELTTGGRGRKTPKRISVSSEPFNFQLRLSRTVSPDPSTALQHTLNTLLCLKLAIVSAEISFWVSSGFLDESLLGQLQKPKGHVLECHQEEEVARFHAVIANPRYRANPLTAISEHLSKRLRQEEEGKPL
ncbi:Fam207a [Columba guinea]|nr:Fam207a [Columba guinea]